MRLLTFLPIILLTLTAVVIPAMATTGNNVSSAHKSTATLRVNPQSQHPRVPGLCAITVEYADGIMEFEFPVNASYLIVSVKDAIEEDVVTGIVSVDDPALAVTLNEGEYIVTCTTDLNQIFTGTLNINL